jgi:transcriptional repressor NrdR
VVKILKRDGRSEDFAYEKVVVSCLKSGAPIGAAREIAKNVEAKVKENMPTPQIKKLVLEALKAKNPDWERNWSLYDRAVKKRTA